MIVCAMLVASTLVSANVAASPLQATALSLPNASGALDGGAELQASLTAAGSGLAGQTVAFAVYGGASLGSATTDGSGQADLLANLQGLSAGTYTITASFAGSSQYQASQATASLTVQGQGDLGNEVPR